MCGIAGIIKKNTPISSHPLKILEHRGPDDEGFFIDEDIWLGHKRLAIIDLSSNAHQPMISEDENYIIIFNGEIYNHLSIRKALKIKGYHFKSNSDTETLLYGFIEYNESLFEKINGIFAIAIYNKKEKKLTLARDQFGVKPLYLYEKENDFMFSSEIKFFSQFPIFNKELDMGCMHNYIQFMYNPGNDTLFKHVKKLAPGNIIQYDLKTKKHTTRAFYKIDYLKEQKGKIDEQFWIKEIETVLLQSIERQLLSDAPLGFFLSGGLDSSLVVAMAQKILGNKLSYSCYTIDTGDNLKKEGFEDDLYYARKVATHLQIKLHEISSDIGYIELFDKIIWHLDEPQTDPAAFHVYNICNAAHNAGIKVLLGGTAGDDVFSGYRRHQALNAEKYIKYIPDTISKFALNTIQYSGINNQFSRRLSKLLDTFHLSNNERLVAHFCWIKQDKISRLFKSSFQNKTSKGEKYLLEKLDSLNKTESPLNEMLFLEMKGFLPDHNLNYLDKISMAANVESRVPYLDLELFQKALELPTALKMKGNTTKYILKKIAEKYIPKDIIYRKKTGFAAPVRQWVKKDMEIFINQRLLESNVLYRDFFNKKEVEILIQNNMNNKVDASYSILALASIESWLRQFYYN